MALRFNDVYGSINSVPIEVYSNLIKTYVDKVSKVIGVKSIIQIGSFKTLGLSDIDLILVIDSNNPPEWEEISIKNILKGEQGFEVVAHDIFVYPDYLSEYIHGLFYIDNVKVLFGDNIGGGLNEDEVNGLKLILSFEYTVQRLESLLALVYSKKVNSRNILLFISTIRHTYDLLYDFDLISKEVKELKKEAIELLRKHSLDNRSKKFNLVLDDWIEDSFKVLFNGSILLAKELGYDINSNKKKWILNYKKLVISIDNVDEAWLFVNNLNNVNRLLKGKVMIQPLPSYVFEHCSLYKKMKKIKSLEIDRTKDLMKLRYDLANQHFNFINFNNYPIPESYTIINKRKGSIMDFVKMLFLKVFSFLWVKTSKK